MLNRITLFASLLGLLILFACSTQKQTPVTQEGDFVFVGVNVLPMTENTVLENQTVIIRDGKIFRVGSSSDLKIGDKATLIEAKGQYLMPGISEMHAHIPTPQDDDDENVRETLFLYLSNGITLIRGMLGNPYHLELKEQIADGSILSPRVFTSSPSMNGNSVKTIEEAQTKVSQYKKDGYDFLKIHPGIQLDVFEELINTARQVEIPFSGHVPVAVGIDRAIDFRYASIDHLDGYIDGLIPKTVNFDRDGGGMFGYNFTDKCDPGIISDIVKRTKEAGIWIVPTQSLLVRWLAPKSGAEMINGPEMVYITPSARFQWRQAKDRFMSKQKIIRPKQPKPSLD